MVSLDLLLETIHRQSDYDRSFKEKFISNYKYLFKALITLIIIIDYIYFKNTFPSSALRIARYFRPCKIINWF